MPALSEADAAAPDGSRLIYQVAEEQQRQANQVHLGGQLAGFNVNLNGVMVVEFGEVDTAAGKASLKSDLRIGDIIERIEGESVLSSEDIIERLNANKKETYRLSVRRAGDALNLSVSPLVDRISGEYRLGVLVKNDIAGIGTVTFTKQNGRFAALGHEITGGVGSIGDISGGSTYECKLVGIERGTKGRAGSVKGTISSRRKIGSIDKNIPYGVYGRFSVPEGELIDVAKRDEVRPGKARIRCSVGGEPKFYDIEIVKTVQQPTDKEKGMVVKVVDKELLSLTGGIIQGMSGSPIIQNNKLVGAITHVFIKDPTRGYGLYADWMVGQ